MRWMRRMIEAIRPPQDGEQRQHTRSSSPELDAKYDALRAINRRVDRVHAVRVEATKAEHRVSGK